MAKRVIWTDTAKKARREILEYWIYHNRSNTYSKKLSKLFRNKVKLLQTEHYQGKPTDFENVRVSLVNNFSLFYKANKRNIIIMGIWDNRRNPEDLRKNLEL
ncbi:MAG: type II toxin-antitoxin system RelE/ParE family toxin [Bacteroidota bacterium]|nr:type II toxin-antitoxin system RelE/ParE family toxin [Bacteroidota bacterium]